MTADPYKPRPAVGAPVVAVLLALVVIAGGAWRGYHAANPNPHRSGDEHAYVEIALRLAEDGTYRAANDPDRFGDRAFHWPPGAPALFAIAHLVAPSEAGGGEREIPAAHWAQALVGTLLILVAFAVATMLGGRLAGLVAATAVALYPPLAYAPGDLLSEPLGALMLSCAFLAVAGAVRRPGPWLFLAAGALLGAAVLTRADLLPVPFAVTAAAAVGLRRLGP
ncbi:MAG: glycosyltransferase family 39 protein, partial [Actinomycetota bacterium]|nr:glycosyltransferase family 39 protein [Actinomycetota bacterium]